LLRGSRGITYACAAFLFCLRCVLSHSAPILPPLARGYNACFLRGSVLPATCSAIRCGLARTAARVTFTSANCPIHLSGSARLAPSPLTYLWTFCAERCPRRLLHRLLLRLPVLACWRLFAGISGYFTWTVDDASGGASTSLWRTAARSYRGAACCLGGRNAAGNAVVCVAAFLCAASPSVSLGGHAVTVGY